MPDNPGRLGKYEIREELGRGAFATVYRAVDTTLDREVALKILHPQLLTDPTFIGRFEREARAMAKLEHPHIATVHEVGEAEGRVYIALRLGRGPTLGEAIVREGRLTWAQTLAVMRPVCEALDYAHGRGVVHRDLKPSNVLLDADAGPLLTDFGFARLMGDSSVSLSLSGGILGTPAYIAPEVWELDAAELQADIYALGCIAYEMLTGEVLFAGKTPMQTMRAHDQGPRFPETWPEGAPSGIEDVLSQALARDPKTRYASGNALWNALHSLEAQSEMTQKPTTQPDEDRDAQNVTDAVTEVLMNPEFNKNLRSASMPTLKKLITRLVNTNLLAICGLILALGLGFLLMGFGYAQLEIVNVTPARLRTDYRAAYLAFTAEEFTKEEPDLELLQSRLGTDLGVYTPWLEDRQQLGDDIQTAINYSSQFHLEDRIKDLETLHTLAVQGQLIPETAPPPRRKTHDALSNLVFYTIFLPIMATGAMAYHLLLNVWHANTQPQSGQR
jgi:serine/threonine protein kinase